MSFEDGIDELARSLNAIKYIYTTSSCGGHMESPSTMRPEAPYVLGAVWIDYAPRFMEGVSRILREKRLSAITLTISSPARKIDHLWFGIEYRLPPGYDKQLEMMRKNLSRLAKEITKFAYENPDPIWISLLPELTMKREDSKTDKQINFVGKN